MSQDNLSDLVKEAKNIVVIQADNPDADSLGSAIALEQIFTLMDKHTYMYCGVNIPSYLHYFTGWSRVQDQLPSSFDLAIIVDTSTITLLEKFTEADKKHLSSNPVIVIDHHKNENSIDFANLSIIKEAAATGEIIFNLARENNWQLNQEASDALASSILSDSLGLMSKSTSATTIRIIADLVENGVDLTKLDSLRKEGYRKSLELTKYKGQLLQRLQTHLDGKLVTLTIPFEEITKYSPLYNPPMLVIEDMKLVEGAAIVIAFKIYNDGKISAKIGSNNDYPICNDLADAFGGGGHDYASGFKTYDYTYEELLPKVIEQTEKLLGKL